ncbi:hypothetical protein KIN20_001720 [Parelaphostrongylus tenuis]|uniref:Chondroitin proteoglycan 3 n=1 Tax=Parelaphostrongylus tenuis TaxID=148309 RepID=A0AAD5LU39_PARTN|nr:hypothetical protein KIN20_001720 [Parelaphostrongylus tenuis]
MQLLTLVVILVLDLNQIKGSYVLTASSVDEAIAALQRVSTLKSPESNEVEDEQKNKTCTPMDQCYSDDDCHGGYCFGTFVGKCNCNGCINFLRCETDLNCGGLRNACNMLLMMCDCNTGYRSAGFPQFFDVMTGLCNQKTCNGKNSDEACFGLECNSGRCIC